MASKERLFLIQTNAMCDFKIERDYHSNPHLFKTLRSAERIPPNNATIRLEIHAPFPTEEELRLELDRERKMVEEFQAAENES
ncbi:MAG: hypothetical protein OXI23_15255 [Gemmatimonadota bacterium]|nr:hypothetical protein [Gemmatimonadota bacterium]